MTENTTQDILGRDLVLKEKYDALKAELAACEANLADDEAVIDACHKQSHKDAGRIEELERKLAACEADVRMLNEAIDEAVQAEWEMNEHSCDILYDAQKKVEYEGVALGTYIGQEVVRLRKQIEGLTNALNLEPEYGHLRQDDFGHWYLIPEDEVEAHDALTQRIAEAEWESTERLELAIDEYNRRYSQYRVEGGLYQLRVSIEDGDG